jgi:anaerobic magnesium-protoporphyrin IX monomethyl ester cyclase
MRIILLNPPIDSVLENGNVSPVTQYLFYNSAPLGILYIAALLEQEGYTVSVIDAAAEELNITKTIERVKEFQPDIIGIGSFTVTFETTCKLADQLRQTLPETPIVLGSYHVTLVPHDAMSHTCFDVGVLNEGEFTMLELVEYYENHTYNDISGLDEIDGICYREPDENSENGWSLKKTKVRTKFKNLDKLPFPARHLLPPNIYKPIPVDNHATPKFSMVSSRGCPHACAFCQKSRTGYRSHSAKYVVDEMEHLVRDFGAKDIAFVDSLFCANKKRVHAICDEILSRGLQNKLSWTCSSRVEVVDKPLLQKMKQAGCWRTRFGIESGHDTVLDFISKGITQDKIKKAITAAHEVGLRPKAFFMVGHMPDTRERIIETINFAKSIPLHDITVQINTLLPETPQLEIWKREGHKWGRLVNTTTDEKSFWEPTFVPWGLESDDLIELHRRFYREFYLRPITLQRHLASIKTMRDVYKYFEAASLFSFLFFDQERLNLTMLKHVVKDKIIRRRWSEKVAAK